MAACGESAAIGPTPTPRHAYVQWSDAYGDLIFIEVNSEAALKDFLTVSSSITAQELVALPAGAAITCHKRATVDNSDTTIWDDGTPGGKTLAQEACNRH